jgi:spore cortex biosynthesis protein YabQ
MIVSMPGQAWLFLSTVCVGATVGLFYDIFRIFRKTAAHPAFVVHLEDFVFWLAVTGMVFYFMLSRTYGEIRLFTLLGAGTGAALYFSVISPWVLRIMVPVVIFIKRVIASAFRIILLPFSFLFNLLRPPAAAFFQKRRRQLRLLARYGNIRVKKAARNWFIFRKKV